MGNHSMPLAIFNAVQMMEQRHEEWKKNHPDEQEEVCPICKGTGLKRIYKDYYGHERSELHKNDPGTYEYIEPCICTKGMPTQKMVNDKNFANVPSLYKDALMSNFRLDIYTDINARQTATSAYNYVVFYINRFADMSDKGIGLYIYSRSKGCGKSRLASSISNELSNRGYRNKYASASGILNEIKASWNNNQLNETKIINDYIKPNLLIIDDFGAMSGQDWMDEKFFNLLDKRYQENKPTIITSNYEIEKIPFKDQRITDRLQDVDRFVVIKMPNVSVRNKSREGATSIYHQMFQAEREKIEKEKGANNVTTDK